MAEFIYQNICNEISKAIDDGILLDGDKLESVRQLAKNRKIGVSTAIHIYRTLERHGRIVAVAKKGYFVDNPNKRKAHSYGEVIVTAKELCQLPLLNAVQYSFSSPSILPLSCTSPSSVVDSEAILNSVHRKALTGRPYRIKNHNPIETSKALRIEIAKHLMLSGHRVKYQDILLVNGRNDGLLIALQACQLLKARVALEAPCSLYFQSIIEQLQIESVGIPMQADFTDELALLNKTFIEKPFAAYLINPNFNDPTGRALCETDKKLLINWAEKNAVILIEYDRGDLHFSGQRPAPLTTLLNSDSNCQVISITDFYDTVSDRLGMGYLICKNSYEQCLFSQQATSDYPLVSTQLMILALFQSGQYQRLLNKIRSQLSQQHLLMQRMLTEQLKDEIELGMLYISAPTGGPCLWLGLPQGKSSHTLWQKLIKQNIAIAPGGMFVKQALFERYFRVTFGLPWDQTMETGVKNLAKTIKLYLSQ
jgi:DNA-binding transcriptional MocR family regulator